MRRCALVIGIGIALSLLFMWPAPTAMAYIDYDCADFEYQEEAQAEYESDYDDPYRLDGDNDGIACEALPSEDDYSDYNDEDSYDNDYASASSYDDESSYSTTTASLSDTDSASSETSNGNESLWGWLFILFVVGSVIYAAVVDS